MVMRIAVLVKQVPQFDEMELGPDGRLRRDNVDLEMNPYCRRAVSKGVELASERDGSRVSVVTLGPPPAEDTLREAIAWGLARDVEIEGVLVTDPIYAGSDTIRTAAVLAKVLQREGPFELDPHGPQLGRRRHGAGWAADRRAARPSVPHRRAPSRDRRKPRAAHGANTTTAGCRPRSSCPRFSRPRNGCANRRRSIPPTAPRTGESYPPACARDVGPVPVGTESRTHVGEVKITEVAGQRTLARRTARRASRQSRRTAAARRLTHR